MSNPNTEPGGRGSKQAGTPDRGSHQEGMGSPQRGPKDRSQADGQDEDMDGQSDMGTGSSRGQPKRAASGFAESTDESDSDEEQVGDESQDADEDEPGGSMGGTSGSRGPADETDRW